MGIVGWKAGWQGWFRSSYLRVKSGQPSGRTMRRRSSKLGYERKTPNWFGLGGSNSEMGFAKNGGRCAEDGVFVERRPCALPGPARCLFVVKWTTPSSGRIKNKKQVVIYDSMRKHAY